MNTIRIPRNFILFAFFISISYASVAQMPAEKKEVIFTKFTISNDAKRIAINWSTDATVATNYFEIQKSVDGINFKTIALVLGPDPKQASGNCYGCFDKYIARNAKHTYYRLKHIDTNGTEQLSESKLLN